MIRTVGFLLSFMELRSLDADRGLAGRGRAV